MGLTNLFERFGVNKVLDSTKAFASAQEIFFEMRNINKDILKNKELCDTLRKEIHMPNPKKADLGIVLKVILVFYIDFVKCLQNMGHSIDFKKRDSYLLPLALNLKFKQQYTTELEFKEYMAVDSVKYLYEGLLLSFGPWAEQDGPELLFTRFAKDVDKEICKRYVGLMIKASRYIKEVNPGKAAVEDKWISNLQELQF